jgi:pimeloyl-ACP methyl ester carboxylesterase
MATFVLCHGGWVGGWVWGTIPDLLRAKGHRAFTPTFTGVGERVHLAHPGIDLDTHVTDVVNVIQFEELYDVILVGHSYGGMVITGVADRVPDRLGHLVYLDAFVPQDGQSLSDLIGTEITAFGMSMAGQQGDGWTIPPIPLGPSGPLDPRLAPQPIKTVTQSVRLRNRAALALPRTFIYCTQGKDEMYMSRPITQAAQVAQSDPSWHYYELETGHGPMVDMPQELANLLAAIAAHPES